MRKLIFNGSRKLSLLGIIKAQKSRLVGSPVSPTSNRDVVMKMDEARRYIGIRALIPELTCASLYLFSTHLNGASRQPCSVLSLLTSGTVKNKAPENLIIKLLSEKDIEIFWPLRLKALQEEPSSFGADYEESKALDLKDVASRLACNDDSFVLGAFCPDLIGCVGLFREHGKKARHQGTIWGMYVTPGISRTKHRASADGGIDYVCARAS